MGCVKPLLIPKSRILAPCGQCPACRTSRATSWSARLAHEMAYHDTACFVTFTIDDEHMPENGSLEKRRLQLYFKRLRKSLGDRKIKYYACGEYGVQTYRAHYHAIIFGLGTSDDDKRLIEDAWHEDGKPIGHIKIGLCEMRSIHYVAGYVRKKIEGIKDYEYRRLGFEPPFTLQSQGLGLQYALDHAEQLKTSKTIHLNGLLVPIPRYYCDKLGIDPVELRNDAEKRSAEKCMELLDKYSDKLGCDDEGFDKLSREYSYREILFQFKTKLGFYRQKQRNLAAFQNNKRKQDVF